MLKLAAVEFVIPGAPPNKKNSTVMFRAGGRRGGRGFPVPSKKVQDYEAKVTALANQASLDQDLRFPKGVMLEVFLEAHADPRADIDGVPLAILDGIKHSRLIVDDVAFRKMVVELHPTTVDKHVRVKVFRLSRGALKKLLTG